MGTTAVRTAPDRSPRRQRGAAFLVLAIMLGIAAAAFIVSSVPAVTIQLAHDKQTDLVLATARDALMAYAASVPDSARLGDLPCPSQDRSGVTAGSCGTAASRIGFLPWKTLGLPELLDGDGAPLVYAVSTGFKYNPRSGILNADTPGELTVDGVNAIAVVFAPGPVLANQTRNSAFSLASYLELQNADGDTVFTSGLPSTTFNDRLLALTPAQFFPPLEMRAMRVARERLLHYYATAHRFPSADRYLGAGGCQAGNNGGGRVPYFGSSCLLGGGGASAGQWTMAWPAWFFDNYWDYMMHYAPSERCIGTSTFNCDGGGNNLRLDGSGGIHALLIRQGLPNGQTRPCSSPSQCLDDAENRDTDRDFITPVAGNDKLTIISP